MSTTHSSTVTRSLQLVSRFPLSVNYSIILELHFHFTPGVFLAQDPVHSAPNGLLAPSLPNKTILRTRFLPRVLAPP